MSARFNERLSLLLMQNGLTQKELAERAGVTEAAMSHYIRGDRTPRASVLARIADALNTSTDYLLGGEEPDHSHEIQMAQKLIARNVHQMSIQDKMNIIRIMMGND